jgi:hypothetical protein
VTLSGAIHIAPLFLAKFLAHHQLESRPYLADGADFDIDEAQGKGDLAYDIFRDGGGHLGRFLRPGHPYGCVGIQGFSIHAKCFGQFFFVGDEQLNQLYVRAELAFKHNLFGKRLQRCRIITWCAKDRDMHRCLDAQFLGKWCPGVAGGGGHRSL